MHWSKPLIRCLAATLVLCTAAFCLAEPWANTTSQAQSPAATPSPHAIPSSIPNAPPYVTASPAREPQTSAQESPTPKKEAPEFTVIIDPSHGGDDKGVIYSSKLLEKEITLSFARELRKELDDRGIASQLLRETDVSMPMEKRAEIANSHHNAVYVAIHAGRTGQGVRIYSAVVPADSPHSGPFVPWSTAQTGALPRSRILVKAVLGELQKRKIPGMGLNAPLRPLNNIAMPAIAVELSPPVGDSRSSDIFAVHPAGNFKTQTAIAAAVASGIATSRAQMGVHP